MKYVDELIAKTKVVKNDYDYWIKLHDEIRDFRKNKNTSKEDLEKLEKEAYLNKVGMIYNGIINNVK